MTPLIQFLFIVAVPVVLVIGGLVTLFLVGAVFDAAENPEALSARIEGVFRRPPKSARPLREDHYYRPFWDTP